MSLAPQTRLGPYEIVSTIGAGGMGEVYRATDTRLGREVALKVLPEEFAADAERMARFEREAKVLALLNHPNIAAIYGFEESGDVRALIMELVEGQTLADRITQGSMPLDEALPIAKQIAEGLEYAHERGIVHRDLKPANIKITPEGTVKLLDFGLAKALEGEAATADPSTSPTLSLLATQAGVILGTAAYMSPEQGKGKPVDRRADIWAFGCVLYEMLTGKKPFEGETVTDMLAAVLRAEPAWGALPGGTPPAIQRLLGRCLTKEPKLRLRDIGEARITIDEVFSGAGPQMAASAGAAVPLWRRVLPWAAAGLLALALAVALFALLRAPATPARPVTRLDVFMGNLRLAPTPGSHIAISPDGQKMVFVASEPGSRTPQLYLRSMDNLSITPLPSTLGAKQPFFSPDSQWVGFLANGKLMKMPLSGGLPVKLCDIPGNNFAVGATWADNGSIFFIRQGKVNRVPAGGGTPQSVAGADQGNLGYRWVTSLPGSRGLLLTASNAAFTEFDIDVLSLESGKTKRLVEGGSWPRYLPTGQILYAQFSSAGGRFTGGLLAVPFDLKRLAVTGSPIPVIEGVRIAAGGSGFYDVAADGTLVYDAGSGSTASKRLAWLDSKGVHALPAPPGNYRNISISPDGKRLATTVAGPSQDIYIYDLIRSTMQRLTFEGSSDYAVFTPDGSRLIYDSTGANGQVPNLWWRPADGSGKAERLTTSKFPQHPASVSPDGKLVAYFQGSPIGDYDLYVMPLEGDRKPRVLLHAPYLEVLPMFSPDGKWIAYVSSESGKFAIFVQAYPGPGGKYQIGGTPPVHPVWSRDGKKLYYDSGGDLMEVDVTTHPTFSAGTPRLVAANLGIAQTFARNFDVAPDGRILFAQRSQQSQQESSRFHVVLNFATEVRHRLLAAKQ